MFNLEITAEILGWLSLFFLVTSAQQKTGKNIILFQGVGNVLCTLHYFMNSAFQATMVILIATFRNIVGYFIHDRYMNSVMSAFAIAPFIVVACISNDLTGYIGASGAALVSIGTIFRDRHVILVRSCNFLASAMWLIFSIFLGSVPMTIANAINITSIITGIIRHEEVCRPLREAFARQKAFITTHQA